MVEFALVAPIFFLAVFVFVIAGWVLGLQMVLNTAANRGLSLASVIPNLDVDCTAVPLADRPQCGVNRGVALQKVLDTARQFPLQTLVWPGVNQGAAWFIGGTVAEPAVELVLSRPNVSDVRAFYLDGTTNVVTRSTPFTDLIFPPGEPLGTYLQREPMEVTLRVRVRTGLFGTFTLVGRALGFRELKFTSSLPTRLDCRGNPIPPGGTGAATCPCSLDPNNPLMIQNGAVCSCVGGSVEVTSGGVVVNCVCPAPTVLDPAAGECAECPAPLTFEDGQCVCDISCDGGNLNDANCTCECPENFNYSNGLCCPDGQSNTDGICCTPPQENIDGSCSCPADIECADGTINPTSCECECRDGFYNSYGRCCRDGTVNSGGICCPPPQQNVDGTCQCPSGIVCDDGTINSETCVCECPDDQHLSNGRCCPADEEESGGRCCPPYLQNVGGICACPPGASGCTGGTFTDNGSSCVCNCDPGETLSDGVCCPPGESGSGDRCCPNGTQNMGGICCAPYQANVGGVCACPTNIPCSGGDVIDTGSSCVCDCPGTQVLSDGLCCDPGTSNSNGVCCPPGQVGQGGICCPPPQVNEGSGCQCPSSIECVDGTINQTTCVCECPDDFSLSSGRCCPNGTSNSGGLCCPTGEQNTGGICCRPHLSNVGGVCECPASGCVNGTPEDTGSSCRCNCPTGAIFSNGTCSCPFNQIFINNGTACGCPDGYELMGDGRCRRIE